jgi:hypothetical protein
MLAGARSSGPEAALRNPPEKPSIVSLVPAANWQLLSSQKLDVSAVSRWGGDPSIDREYGVKSMERRTYGLPGKLPLTSGEIPTADVLIEEGPDASAAYGLFTYYRTGAMIPEKNILLAVTSPGGALMARNRAFVRVFLPAGSPVSSTELQGLLITVGGTRPSEQGLAGLPTGLPAAGLVMDSEKYFLGPEASRHVLPSFNADLIGFSQGAEAQVAQYRMNAQGSKATQGAVNITVLAITYPTPQIAQQRFAVMEKMLDVNRDQGAQSVYGRRRGSFVILTMNADFKRSSKLLDQFSVSKQVSWDQRYPGDKPVVWQMVELVVANFLLAFLLAGFAVLAGVLIVVSKRAAGKWFPGWEWGNQDGETLTRLNLTLR